MNAAIVQRTLLSDVDVLYNLIPEFRYAQGLPVRDQISKIAVASVFKQLIYGEIPQDSTGINACYKAGVDILRTFREPAIPVRKPTSRMVD